MRTVLKDYWWRSGGAAAASAQFSGVASKSENPIVNMGTDQNQRALNVVRVGSTEYGAYIVGGLGTGATKRLGARWFSKTAGTEFNSTNCVKQTSPTYLFESQGSGNFQNIDAFNLFQLPWGGWGAIIGDYDSGKIGYCQLDQEPLDTFTLIGTISDQTAATGTGYQYQRHPTKPILVGSTWHFFVEGRQGASNGSGVVQRRIYHLTATDPGDNTFPTSFTTNTTAAFDPESYSDEEVRLLEAAMPSFTQLSNGKYYLTWLSIFHQSSSNFDQLASAGVYYSVADTPAELGSANLITRYRPFLHIVGTIGDFDGTSSQEYSLYEEASGGIKLFYNGCYPLETGFQCGVKTLTKGTFNDVVDAPLFSDDCGSVDATKWTYTTGNGITVTSEYGWLKIQSDGAQNVALAPVYVSKTTWRRIEAVQELAFDYIRRSNTGGDVAIGFANAGDTNIMRFRKGATNRLIKLEITLNSSVVLSEEVSYFGSTLRALMTQYASFWTDYNSTTTSSGWINLATTGNSAVGTKFEDVASWPDEDLYVKIWVENNVAGAATVLLNDIIVHNYTTPLIAPYVISDVVTEQQTKAVAKLPNTSSPIKTRLETYIAGSINAVGTVSRSNWYNLDMFQLCIVDSADDLQNLIDGIAMTNTLTTHDANGRTFVSGSSVATNVNPNSNAIKCVRNNFFLAIYVKTAGTLGANRVLFGANDATTQVRLYYRSSDNKLVFRINSGSTGDSVRSTAGFVDDTLIVVGRTGSTSGGLFMDINGVSQAISGGVGSNGLCNSDPWEGADDGGGNNFLGTAGLFAYGNPNGYERSGFNTRVRALLGV